MSNTIEWLIKPHMLGFLVINAHSLAWWVGQLCGMIGFVITGVGYFQRCEKRLKTLLAVSGLFWMANFWFIGALTPCLITLLNTVRQGISRVCHDSESDIRKKINNIFVVLNVVACLFSWQGWISLFATCASILAGYATLILTGKPMRFVFLLSESCWCVNNFYYTSIGGLCANAINFPILIYYVFKKEKENEVKNKVNCEI